MIRRPPRSTQSRSSAASDVYKRQIGLDMDQGRSGGVVRIASDKHRRPARGGEVDGAEPPVDCPVLPRLGEVPDQDDRAVLPLRYGGQLLRDGPCLVRPVEIHRGIEVRDKWICILYTSDAAD